MTRRVAYLVTRGDATDENFDGASDSIIETVRSAAECGVDFVQIREKQLTTRSLVRLAERAVAITRGTGTQLLVNDRTDVALAVGADGVHLTSTSIPTHAVRNFVPDGFIIGRSTHSEDEVVKAKEGGADFAVFGPIFPTPGKPEGRGIEIFSRLCEAVAPFPVIAIGAIDETNVDTIIKAGASGVAAIRALNDVDRMRTMVRLIHGE